MQYHTLADVCGEERIDTRDLVELRKELCALSDTDFTPKPKPSESEAADIATIDELADAVGHEWSDGVDMIRENAFEDYARELAEDIGAVPLEYTWPTSCIDWKQAARELAMDYTTVDFLGHTYYVRP